jgi:hypothetical protein
MSDLQIKGKIVKIFDLQTFDTKSGNQFTKQEFVIQTDGDYPQTIKLEATQKSCEPLANAHTGDVGTFYFNLKGYKYTKGDKEMYFNTLQVWRMEIEESAELVPDVPAAKVVEKNSTNDYGDELPF